MSRFFSNAHDVSVTGGIFSHVQGDQHNHTSLRGTGSTSQVADANHLALIAQAIASTSTVHVNGNQINQIIQQEAMERTEYDNFRNLKSGDFYRIEDICVVEYCRRPWWYPSVPNANKIICVVKVKGTEDRFTAVSYSGPEARKAFEEDIRKCSRALSSETVQVHAIDIGTIPSLIFWHDLVPFAHFARDVGSMGQIFLQNLLFRWRCLESELWMDPTRGVLCHGPEGPESAHPGIGGRTAYFGPDPLPPTVDLLQEDNFLRFLASRKSIEVDRTFVGATRSTLLRAPVSIPVNQPILFSTLTQTFIAFANNVWESLRSTLVEKQALKDGLTRFRLDGDGHSLSLELDEDIALKEAWLSQASSVFHRRGISLEEDLSAYQLVLPDAFLEGCLDKSPFKTQRRRQQPIYLFVRPPPPGLGYGDTSSLHYWSFHEDSRSPISPESCRDLGLPNELEFKADGHLSHSWSTDNYTLIHRYQLLRGYDPTTIDFARHLGQDVFFQPVINSARFNEVHEDPIYPVDSEGPLSMQGQREVADADPKDDNPVQGAACAREDEFTTSEYDIAAKRQRSDMGLARIEIRNCSDQDLYHKNDTTSDKRTTESHFPRPVRPLPTRAPLEYTRVQQGHPSQNDPVDYISFGSPSCPYYYLPTNRSPVHDANTPTPSMFTPPSFHTQQVGLHGLLQYTTAPAVANTPATPLPSKSYTDICTDTPNLNSDPAYTDPSVYSVSPSTTVYDSDTVDSAGCSGQSESETPSPCHVPPLFVASNDSGVYSIPVMSAHYPSKSNGHAHLPHWPLEALTTRSSFVRHHAEGPLVPPENHTSLIPHHQEQSLVTSPAHRQLLRPATQYAERDERGSQVHGEG
ncbi:hypothetical protein PQX77_011237 [Marasmius sp. AFHP31]|nr:hypothetical protein PQX77_011237 [Marasmius sp. AFHP31]